MTTDTIDALKQRSRGTSLGLFAADAGDLRVAARQAVSWGCDILHFDIMDGVFVPQMTGGASFVKALDVEALRDVHLMIDNPADHVESYVAAGADIITIHAEAKEAAAAVLRVRRAALATARPVMVGIGLMPGTSLEDIGDLLDMAPDMILVLSLDPRINKPPDIGAACTRIETLRRHFGPAGPILAFDGGVTLQSIDEIANCAPDMVVSGSAVFGADDPAAAFAKLAKAT